MFGHIIDRELGQVWSHHLTAVDRERRQVRVVQKSPRVDVDRGLAATLGTHDPLRVDHTPELGTCSRTSWSIRTSQIKG